MTISYPEGVCPENVRLFHIHPQHNALASERFGSFSENVRAQDGCGIHADLFGSSQQHLSHVFQGADPPSHGKGMKMVSATRRTTSIMMGRLSLEAVMS